MTMAVILMKTTVKLPWGLSEEMHIKVAKVFIGGLV
jgi:hypothetical protein